MADAVIFDMDGTLLDTERFNVPLWCEALEHFGHHMSYEDALELRSLDIKLVIARLTEMFGPLELEPIATELRRLIDEHVREHGIDVKPGAVELLSSLREKGITVAVATSTSETRARRYLDAVGLTQYIDRIVSAESVSDGKPAPDVYLYVCKQLGLEPGDCIAVEDSPNGVRSASSAGCVTYMVRDLTPADSELLALIRSEVLSLSELQLILTDGLRSQP